MSRSALQRYVATTAAAVSLAIIATSRLAAQASPVPLMPGTRVQVQAFGAREIGTVQEIRGDTLVIRATDSRTLTRSRSDVERLWVSDGRRSAAQGAWRGFGLGLLIGGLGGAAMGLADGDDEPGMIALSAGEKAILGFVVVGGAGAVAGAVLGAGRPGERWTRVDRRTIAIRPTTNGGLALAVNRYF